jgi:hypothetical protein
MVRGILKNQERQWTKQKPRRMKILTKLNLERIKLMINFLLRYTNDLGETRTKMKVMKDKRI